MAAVVSSQGALFGPPLERRRSMPDLVCQHCGGRRFWFDIDAWRWQCWACVTPTPRAYDTGWLRMRDTLLVATAREDGSHLVDIVPREAK